MIRHLTNIESTANTEGLTILRLKISSITAKKFVHNAFSFTLVTMGELRLTVNQVDYMLHAGDLLYLPAGAAGYMHDSMSPVAIHSLSFTAAFLEEHLVETSLASHYRGILIGQALLHHLEPTQTKRIRKLYEMLRIGGLSHLESFKNEVQKLHFNLLICELNGIYAGLYNTMPVQKNEILLLRFLTLVKKHVRKEHKVNFYAATLCISADHLTKIIRQVSHKTAKQCIEQALITEAKKLLNRKELSVIFITEELEFSSMSTFSNFFKKHTKLTPSAFRQKHGDILTSNLRLHES